MSHNILIDSYTAYFNEIVEKYASEQIEVLIEDVNSDITSSDIEKTKNISTKISSWNHLISKVQDVRNFLLSYDETMTLPPINKFLIVFDKIANRWRLGTEIG